MSTKKRLSKLDQYASQLVEMEAAGSTLAQMQAWLKEEGCTVALSNLSTYLSAQRQSRLQSSLLQQIASGAQQCKEVEKQFGSNPAPEMTTIIKLLRVFILQLSTQAGAQPELFELVNPLVKSVMDYVKTEQKEKSLAFDERKLALLEKKAAQADQTDKVLTDAELTPAERAQRIKEIYGRA